MKCVKCGNEMRETNLYCSCCGASRTENSDIEDTQRIYVEEIVKERKQEKSSFCKNCGKIIPEGYSVCPECIERMKISSQRSVQKEGSSNVVLIVTAIVSALLIIMAIVIVLMFRNGFFVNTANLGNQEQNSTYTVVSQNTKQKVKKYYVGYPKSSNHIMTWHEAAAEAASRGGRLACPNSREEFDEICAMAQEKGLCIIWLGAERNVGQSWESVNWYDGTPMLYTKWFQGKVNEPSYTDKGRDELYLTACMRDTVWGYNDSPSNIEYAFKASQYAQKVGYIMEKEE